MKTMFTQEDLDQLNAKLNGTPEAAIASALDVYSDHLHLAGDCGARFKQKKHTWD